VVDAATALAPGSAPVLCGAVPARGRCYSISVAPGSGVCGEARDGACVGYAEENSVDGERRRTQSSSAQNSMQGAERVREATCADNKLVTIGDAQLCTKCAEGSVPINGVCTAFEDDLVKKTAKCTRASAAPLQSTDTVCAECGGDGYFLFMGGCYSKDGSPGSLVCTAVSAGKCDTCKADGNVFPNQAAQKTLGSECILCSDTTGADDNLGVENCATCTAPTTTTGTATCTRCVAPNYLTTTGTCDSACAADTKFSVEDEQNGKRCFACGDTTNGVDGCEKCTAPSEPTNKPTCTKCSTNYLKTVDGTTTCVEKGDCKDDYFTVDDPTNGNKCISCGDTVLCCWAPRLQGGPKSHE
ncbi:Variant-specific surface protein, partial [Giardia duodenalis]